ncbi:hypothetical protein M2271_000711 [Streptomyces sp. LBL]|uniref:hypothetical protein n=1 Tax=Streptomyces sp. LBL TaxID=2940562 RepID=UPI0024761D54|nr:hypothetical protein [Streptomyces sp. LBL]MDH6622924.1 hypothetical protein [Streptomyces sp. LBL]
MHGSGLTRSLAFGHTEDGLMVSANPLVCVFVPMRGASETGERHVRLAEDVILKLDADDLPDEPAAHLDLRLATMNSGLSFGRLSIGSSARALNLADPAIRWAGAGLGRAEN